MTVYNRLVIDGTDYDDAISIKVKRNLSESNSTSSFEISFDNEFGDHSDDFEINNKVEIYADKDQSPATTKIFTGVIEDIQYDGSGIKERIILSGRDYGAVLQDILVDPRVFKEEDSGIIARSLMVQNVPSGLVSSNNVGETGVEISKITFNNTSVFDALIELANLSGYYFYIDEDQDLHFEQRNSISSDQLIGYYKDDSVLHYYCDDNATSTVVTDSSPYKNNGVSYTNTENLSVEGKIGSAFNMSGPSFFIDCGSSSKTIGNEGLSVGFWFKTDNYSQGTDFPRFLTREYKLPVFPSTRNGWLTTWVSGTNPSVRFGWYNNDSGEAISSTDTIHSGTWHHFFGTYKSGGNMSLYLDGTLQESKIASIGPGSSQGQLLIGSSFATGENRVFDGDIDDIRVFNREVKEKEVKKIYNNGQGIENGGIGTGNVLEGGFRKADHEIFNQVTVFGDRQLTGAREEFITGTDNVGSIYGLTDRPYNTFVSLSGASNTVLQPGGIFNINDPGEDNSKYLVDFNGQRVILTSGTVAGDNTIPNGSILIIDYQRSTPLVARKEDSLSNSLYGPKHKIISDKNIKDLDEANSVANTFLEEHSDPRIQGDLKLDNVLSLTPGHTVNVNLPYQGISGATYQISTINYNFNKNNNLSDEVMGINVNRNIADYNDIMKDVILRLRKLEGQGVDTFITNIQLETGSIGVSGTTTIVQKFIGSGFWFGLPNHNILNSPNSLLGIVEGGSTVLTL